MSISKFTKDLNYEKTKILKSLLERFGSPGQQTWIFLADLIKVPIKEIEKYIDSKEGKESIYIGDKSPIKHDIKDLLDLEDNKRYLTPCDEMLQEDIDQELLESGFKIEQLNINGIYINHSGTIKDFSKAIEEDDYKLRRTKINDQKPSCSSFQRLPRRRA